MKWTANYPNGSECRLPRDSVESSFKHANLAVQLNLNSKSDYTSSEGGLVPFKWPSVHVESLH